MADWQQLLQSVLLGLIFSYLLAKLISVLVSFKEDNLSITRAADSQPPESYSRVETSEPKDRGAEAWGGGGSHDTDSVVAEHGSVRNESVVQSEDSDSDWEGVESTELDEAFSAATAFVAAAAADRLSQRVSNDVQLQLYGLYKIATEGPCTTSQPSALKMTARAKWQAWNKLGAMPPEAAMEKYIDIVTELYPAWLSGSSVKSRGGESNAEAASGPMGPVFSTFVYEESDDESKMDAIHGYAREGDVSNLLKSIESGVPVDLKDSEGRTPLHWAVDRGHLEVAELLVGKNADINAKDNDGQTALHYAVVCEREKIAEFLVKQKASTDIKDNDGSSPSDMCDAQWSFMGRAEKSA